MTNKKFVSNSLMFLLLLCSSSTIKTEIWRNFGVPYQSDGAMLTGSGMMSIGDDEQISDFQRPVLRKCFTSFDNALKRILKRRPSGFISECRIDLTPKQASRFVKSALKALKPLEGFDRKTQDGEIDYSERSTWTAAMTAYLNNVFTEDGFVNVCRAFENALTETPEEYVDEVLDHHGGSDCRYGAAFVKEFCK